MDKIELLSRQTYMFNKNFLKTPVLIFGCGFVGSNIAYSLYKTGFENLTLVDYDIVEDHNLMNQKFLKKHLGMLKTEALADMLYEESPLDILVYPFNGKIKEYIDQHGLFGGQIIFLSVDDPKARLQFLKYFSTNYLNNTTIFYIGTSGDIIQINVNKGHKDKLIELGKFLDKAIKTNNTDQGLCGEKSSWYLGSLISGLSISHLRLLQDKETYFKEEFFLPKLGLLGC